MINPQMAQMLMSGMKNMFPGGGPMPGGAPGGAPGMPPAGPLPGALAQPPGPQAGGPMQIAPQLPGGPPAAPGGPQFAFGMPQGGFLGMMQGKTQPQGLLGMVQQMRATMPPKTALEQAGMLAPAAGDMGPIY